MLKGGMDRRGTNVRGLLALVATLFAVFVLVPIADAATCGGEAGAASAASRAGENPSVECPDDAGGDYAPGVVHGPCAHGHCHHASTGLAPQGDEQDDLSPRGSPPAARQEAHLASLTPDGLERPPRT